MPELSTGSSVRLSLGTVERIAGAVFLLLAMVCAWVVIELKSDVSKLDDRFIKVIEKQGETTAAIERARADASRDLASAVAAVSGELSTIRVDVATIKADVASIKTQPRRQ